ncbi:MAG: BREX system P-loop protein BrxC [Brumimicrobium sp.]|nr:BREX system P-loop protein BrxC [Brumimicrobium sp.]
MIKDIFKKEIHREIETVVKADDTRRINEEVYEYVITQEIENKIYSLFSSYNDLTTVNGVWISGYFGNGKSHLLKILSYVLSNLKLDDGNFAGEIFANKIENDELLKNAILKAVQKPSEAILFNIEQQVNEAFDSDKSSVLSVFYKMFYNNLGFFGSQNHIAEFEYSLYQQNKYEAFKAEFKNIAALDWEQARLNSSFIGDEIAKTLSKVMGGTADQYQNQLDKFYQSQNRSVDDFGNKVAAYIKSKEGDFRLNFFVDEVGQFIANNVKLMLSLQTIAETLQTKTKSRAWVFVTSQSDIDSLIGHLNQNQKEDFGRIMDRFKVRINLTSSNIDEVIEKRLLDKKEDATQNLNQLFTNEEANLKSLITLSEGGTQFTSIGDQANFVRKYPFLNYQFFLFQRCRISLSSHDAFQGKHSSVGERSMLSVFQQIVKQIGEKDLNTLVSFDKVYDGISTELRPEILTSINTASNYFTDNFVLRVLKVLFLVKYFKEFHATKQNISVLLIDNLKIDLKHHQEQVDKALATLERQNYIQRNGEIYEFLTNVEKDIETEIKNTSIDESKVNTFLKELFFDEIFRNFRIRYQANKQDYEFAPKLDGILVGREKNLGVEIYTPNYDGLNNIDNLKIQSLGLNAVRFVCDADSQFVDDVRLYIKINTYHSISTSKQLTPKVQQILTQKMYDNNERKRILVQRANELLGSSTTFINGEEQVIGHKQSGRDYAYEAFQLLVQYKYPNLRMIGEFEYSEDTFKRIIGGVNIPELFSTDDATISEAEGAILNFVERRRNANDRVSLYDVLKNFNNSTYGWYNNAIFSLLAKLFIKGKIEVKQGENSLEKGEFLNAMLNSSEYATTYIEMETVYSPTQVNRLKEVYSDLFNKNTKFIDPKDIANDFKDELRNLLEDVNSLVYQKHEFPFLANLQKFQGILTDLSKKNYTVYLENIADYEDELLDEKENHYDPIKAFMNGSNKGVYQNIMLMLNGENANFGYVNDKDFAILKQLREEPKPYKGDTLRLANEAKERISKELLALIKAEKQSTKEAYQKTITSLETNEYLLKLDEPKREELLKSLKDELQYIDKERFISNLRTKTADLRQKEAKILNHAVDLTTAYNSEGETQIVSEPRVHYVPSNTIKVNFKKSELRDEKDVEEYLEALKERYLQEIKNNKRIKL